ncbi:MAG: hypothetical protein JXA25_01610 [Anaerolineales bacterium]|nr:hypothetical protein [Anaerolineales bacterium]
MTVRNMPAATLENETLKVEYLTASALRITGLYHAVSPKNILALMPDIVLPFGEKGYPLIGGHRLWASPEEPGWSYGDESGVPLEIEERHNHVRLIQLHPEAAGLRREMTLTLDELLPHLTIKHCLTNDGDFPVFAAPWALTILPPGGLVLLPFPRSENDSNLLPDRNLVFWPYTTPENLNMVYLPNAILLPTSGRKEPAKLGTLLKAGWCGYFNDGLFFKKRIQKPQPFNNYPDFGSSCEVYLAPDFFELETLGALAEIPPGESAVHTETWELVSDLAADPDLAPFESILQQHSA